MGMAASTLPCRGAQLHRALPRRSSLSIRFWISTCTDATHLTSICSLGKAFSGRGTGSQAGTCRAREFHDDIGTYAAREGVLQDMLTTFWVACWMTPLQAEAENYRLAVARGK